MNLKHSAILATLLVSVTLPAGLAWAESDPVDPPVTDETVVDEPAVEEPAIDEPVADGETVDYDPIIAESGVPMPNQRGEGAPGRVGAGQEEQRSSRMTDDTWPPKKKGKGVSRTMFGTNSPWADWKKSRKAD
jgi:hypothetical protein